MTELYSCPKGHRWGSSARPPSRDQGAVCPICGAGKAVPLVGLGSGTVATEPIDGPAVTSEPQAAEGTVLLGPNPPGDRASFGGGQASDHGDLVGRTISHYRVVERLGNAMHAGERNKTRGIALRDPAFGLGDHVRNLNRIDPHAQNLERRNLGNSTSSKRWHLGISTSGWRSWLERCTWLQIRAAHLLPASAYRLDGSRQTRP